MAHAQGNRLSHLDEEDRGWWQVQSTAMLTCIARGEIDAVRLAHEELANRGLDLNGKWVGFEAAQRIHEDWPIEGKTLTAGKQYDVDELRCVGWTDDSEIEGYNAFDYFDDDGTYRGPDEFGVEPLFRPKN